MRYENKKNCHIWRISMNAYKFFSKVESDTLTIQLPTEFWNKRVEIIVLNVGEDEIKENKKENFKKKLLQGPVWSDEDYKNYLDGRKHLENWNFV